MSNNQEFDTELIIKKLDYLRKDNRYTNLKILIEIIISSFFMIYVTPYIAEFSYQSSIKSRLILVFIPWIMNIYAWGTWIFFKNRTRRFFNDKKNRYIQENASESLLEDYRESNSYWKLLRQEEYFINLLIGFEFIFVAFIYIYVLIY